MRDAIVMMSTSSFLANWLPYDVELSTAPGMSYVESQFCCHFSVVKIAMWDGAKAVLIETVYVARGCRGYCLRIIVDCLFRWAFVLSLLQGNMRGYKVFLDRTTVDREH